MEDSYKKAVLRLRNVFNECIWNRRVTSSMAVDAWIFLRKHIGSMMGLEGVTVFSDDALEKLVGDILSLWEDERIFRGWNRRVCAFRKVGRAFDRVYVVGIHPRAKRFNVWKTVRFQVEKYYTIEAICFLSDEVLDSVVRMILIDAGLMGVVI